MNVAILVFVVLALTNFFGAIKIPNSIFIAPIVAMSFLGFHKHNPFRRWILVSLIGILCSVISSAYFRHQDPLLTLQFSIAFFGILFVFVLARFGLEIDVMEKGLFVLSFIFCICYLTQYAVYPHVIFSGATSENLAVDDLRIRLSGQGLSSLGFFYGMNKLMLTKKYKFFYLSLSLVCLLVIILMGFRTMLGALLVLAIVLILRIDGLGKRTIFGFLAAVLAAGLLLQTPLVSQKLERLTERQETENFSNPEYIRIQTLDYYLHQHFNSQIERIFGSGEPAYSRGTQYSIHIEALENNHGLFWVDWGLFGLSWIIGIPSVLAMIIYSVKAILLKVHKRFYYAGTWFCYLLLLSITTKEFYRDGNIVIQAVVLYIIMIANEKIGNEKYRLKEAKCLAIK